MKHLLSRFLLAIILQSQLISAEYTDKGKIAYFEGPCPDGWTDYIKGQGRFIFGEGAEYILGSYGGESVHLLTAEEIPTHSHHMWSNQKRTELASDSHSKQAGFEGEERLPQDNPNLEYYIQGTFGPPTVGKTGTIGGGIPHNNMPPYLTLRACQKFRDTQPDLSQYVKTSTLIQYLTVPGLADFVRSKELNSHLLLFQFEKSKLDTLAEKVKQINCSQQQEIVVELNIDAIQLLEKFKGLVQIFLDFENKFNNTILKKLNIEGEVNSIQDLYQQFENLLKYSTSFNTQQRILLLLILSLLLF